MSYVKKTLMAAVGAGLLLSMLIPSASAATTVSAHLDGASEVPGPGDPDGAGRARIRIEPNAGSLCFWVRWTDIGSPMAAHIHAGAVGVAGPVKVELFASRRPLPTTIDAVHGCIEDLRERLLRTIKRQPDRFYVNVHNRAYPGGAIRGQLA